MLTVITNMNVALMGTLNGSKAEKQSAIKGISYTNAISTEDSLSKEGGNYASC